MIEGERVLLRRMSREDAADVVRMRADPEVQAQLFSGRPPTIEEHLRWLADVEARGDRHEFMIVERTSGRSVGTIGLSHIDRVNRRAEYGVLIGEPDARGKGLAAEASRLLLAYAFGTLGLRRVYLHVLARNEDAVRLYRRVGFQPEGVLRQHVRKGDEFLDVAVMAVLEAPR
ncbi:MAG TPA: GNAT family N-acetyltransferase [Candidatus Binatia bacterium]|nr:GNAT family N-acetyltransferase [Candidatus Binatia bacterium]